MDPLREERIEEQRARLDWSNFLLARIGQPPVAYGLEGDCDACGGPLPPQHHQGNPRRWCSEACRHWAARQDKRAAS